MKALFILSLILLALFGFVAYANGHIAKREPFIWTKQYYTKVSQRYWWLTILTGAVAVSVYFGALI